MLGGFSASSSSRVRRNPGRCEGAVGGGGFSGGGSASAGDDAGAGAGAGAVGSAAGGGVAGASSNWTGSGADWARAAVPKENSAETASAATEPKTVRPMPQQHRQ
ncbi:MAG: hypothetical protein EOO73_05200 [Myxococcales bacterium]|nr:MAG: hypothetical protein EOO73_05200 [Myxococcales bacterium]